jgi:hypothetical protein
MCVCTIPIYTQVCKQMCSHICMCIYMNNPAKKLPTWIISKNISNMYAHIYTCVYASYMHTGYVGMHYTYICTSVRYKYVCIYVCVLYMNVHKIYILYAHLHTSTHVHCMRIHIVCTPTYINTCTLYAYTHAHMYAWCAPMHVAHVQHLCTRALWDTVYIYLL